MKRALIAVCLCLLAFQNTYAGKRQSATFVTVTFLVSIAGASSEELPVLEDATDSDSMALVPADDTVAEPSLKRNLQGYFQNYLVCPQSPILSYQYDGVSPTYPVCQNGFMSTCTCTWVPPSSSGSSFGGHKCYISYTFPLNQPYPQNPWYPYNPYSPNPYMPQGFNPYCANGCTNAEVYGAPYNKMAVCLRDDQACSNKPTPTLRCSDALPTNDAAYTFCVRAAGSTAAVCNIGKAFKSAETTAPVAVRNAIIRVASEFDSYTKNCPGLEDTAEAREFASNRLGIECDAEQPACETTYDIYRNPIGTRDSTQCITKCRTLQGAADRMYSACERLAKERFGSNATCDCVKVTVGCTFPGTNESIPNACRLTSNAPRLGFSFATAAVATLAAILTSFLY